MNPTSVVRALALPVLLSISSLSHATLLVYNSQASFMSATTQQGVDTYSGFNIVGATPSPIIRNAGAYSYTATASTSSFYGAGSTANPWLSTNQATDSIMFSNFSGGAQAIGGNFFGSDISGLFASGSVLVTAVDLTGTSVQTITGATVSSFLGFVSTDTLISLTVSSIQPATGVLWPTVDNLTIARAVPTQTDVPEPGTIALLLGGLGLMGALARRRT